MTFVEGTKRDAQRELARLVHKLNTGEYVEPSKMTVGNTSTNENSGRRVAMALETEIGLKESAKRGGQKVDLPLKDRSLGLNYDWFR